MREYDLHPKFPTPEGKGLYILTVYRPMPFGYGVLMYEVDKLISKPEPPDTPKLYSAYLEDKLVTTFPASFEFMLVARDQYDFKLAEEHDKTELKMDEVRIPGGNVI